MSIIVEVNGTDMYPRHTNLFSNRFLPVKGDTFEVLLKGETKFYVVISRHFRYSYDGNSLILECEER